jgi:hypothetical protein
MSLIWGAHGGTPLQLFEVSDCGSDDPQYSCQQKHHHHYYPVWLAIPNLPRSASYGGQPEGDHQSEDSKNEHDVFGSTREPCGGPGSARLSNEAGQIDSKSAHENYQEASQQNQDPTEDADLFLGLESPTAVWTFGESLRRFEFALGTTEYFTQSEYLVFKVGITD